jgi:hypothetical protein
MTVSMREITRDQFKSELVAQGVAGHQDFAFKCPMCGTVQSARDLIAAGAGKDFDEVEKFLAFSCVGRWTNAGPHKNGRPPGNGCDWTLGGLFRLHVLEVVTDDGAKHPRFELATPEEAQAHALRMRSAAA